MKLVTQQGAEVEVPDEQAPALLQSGQLGLPAGQSVPLQDQDGEYTEATPEEALQKLGQGYTPVDPKEYRKYQLDQKYGGLLGGAAATGEGVARGLSLGVSDPLAVGAARLFGGNETAEKVRRHLEEEKEAHPYLSTGAEIAGALAPVVLSGGAAAPEEAAGILGRIGEGVGTLGAAPRAVSALGDVTEHALGGILGSTADTTLGRVAQSAAKTASRGIVEGGLFGAGQEISEDSLQNQPLTAEKLLSSMGHSALMGGALGAAGGAFGKLAGEGAQSLVGRLAPKLDEEAGEQTWKWLDPGKRFSEEASKRAGGTDAVGRTVYERVLKPLVEEEGLTGAAIDNEKKLELVKAAADKTGADIGELIKGNAHASVPLEEMLEPIDRRISEYSKMIGGEDKVATMKSLRASVTRVLGQVEENPQALEQAEMLARDAGHKPGTPQFKSAVDEFLSDSLHEQQAGKAIPIGDAITQRRALQKIAFEETKALDPKLRVQLLRDVSGEWTGLEEKWLNKATEESGGIAGTRLRELNKEFQRLTIAEKALEVNTARYATNRTLSLSDNLYGAAHFGGALAGGHPVAALGALGTGFVHKALRSHGNAFAAIALDRLATWGGISRAVAEHDSQIESAVDSVLSARPARRIGRPFRTVSGSEASDRRFEKERSRVEELAQSAPGVAAAHLQQRLSPIAGHAPKLAEQIQAKASKATAFLASKMPASNRDPQSTLTPQLAKDAWPPEQRAKFLRYVDAVDGGPPAVLKKLAAGRITPEDVETLKAVYPESYEEIRAKIAEQCGQRTKAIPYQRRLQLGTLFDLPTDPTLDPNFVRAVQKSYQTHPEGPGPASAGAKPLKKSAPASLGITKDLAGPFETAMGGH